MGNYFNQSNRFLIVLSLFLTLFVSACSDDNESTKSVVKNTTTIVDNKKMTPNKLEDKNHYQQMSQPLDKANWVEKGKFRNEFEKDCIARELNDPTNKTPNRKYVEKTCKCIADYMDEHLTDQEAEEFLGEDNHMRALQIRYDAAAFQCISGSDKVKEPKVTRFN